MGINIYDHEDAFKVANLCAGRRIKLVDVLKLCKDKDTAQLIIKGMQDQYENLFEAFIEGVEYGRKNPLPPESQRE